MWRTWDDLLDLWRRAQRAGFDMAFNTDHFQSDWDGDGGPVLEAWTTVAALAREVPGIRIGTYVNGITHRPVAVLAKQALTVDHLSGGRLILGLGAAWNEPEHRAYGLPFPPLRERVGRVEEALQAIRLLERQPRTSFSGSFVQLEDAPFEPKPVGGRIPILIGSTRPRMLRAAARYADFVDLGDAAPEEVARIGGALGAACTETGREPDSVMWMHEAIAGDDPAGNLRTRVGTLAPLGVSIFLVNIWPRSDPALVDRAGRALEELRRAYR
jgi:alkanesulfonate monooxygenase SsuD/methylene tetrahydromethanopterin reductase-like flavin-dependent oxidoreductase (luciferase family)